MNQNFTGLDAYFYDQSMVDWPGEIDFYRALAAVAREKGEAILDVACGTGRVSSVLAREGAQITGIDLSAPMLEIAREKTIGMSNARWVEADMRSFELNERFGLILIPAHSFQFMLTPQDQVACLESVRSHLISGGTLVIHLDHQDLDWLGEIGGDKGGLLKSGKEKIHPQTGNRIRTAGGWSYDRATQTATAYSTWEEIDRDGEVVNRWVWEPKPLHCVFRFEMAHLLARVGFEVKALYGDFYFNDLGNDSPEMVWVATV